LFSHELARRDDIDAGERDIGLLRVAENIESGLLSFLLNAMSVTAAS
jgi:hypothetical protein